MEQEIVGAINVAADPSQQGKPIVSEALNYLNSVRERAIETWPTALNLFVASKPDGGRLFGPQVRLFALHILENLLDNRFEPLDQEMFQTIQQAFIAYIQSEYVYGPSESSAPFLRNKFSHTISLFFLCTYHEQWTSFFTDIFALLRPPENPTAPLNPHISILFFRLLGEISGEVADQMLKGARKHDHTRFGRDARVKDDVRDRDARAINEAVLTIIAQGKEQLDRVRNGEPGQKELLTEVVDGGVRAFASYIPWIDINLTVTPSTIPLIFSLLYDPSLAIRLATSLTLLRMVQKGLKEPSDKLQLLKVLSIGQVLDALEQSTRAPPGGRDDEEEESFRESLGNLANGLGLELVKLCDPAIPSEEVRQGAAGLLDELIPIMHRFLGDPYDDTSSTVFTLLGAILLAHKRAKKSNPETYLTPDKQQFLEATLRVLLQKLKWDADADPEEDDEDDRAAFESLRKEIKVFLDSIGSLDENLLTNAVSTYCISTFASYDGTTSLAWEEAELAVYLVYLWGEFNQRDKGKGRLAFIQSAAVPKELRKGFDYSSYPLTVHGEMLQAMMQSNISSYPNTTVGVQFFETVARYGDFFKVRKDNILPTLQAFVDNRGVHHPKSSVRQRAYYFLHRFVKDVRNDIPVEHVPAMLSALGDALVVHVELPEIESPEQDILTEAVTVTGNLFDSQIYLFEVVGILISLLYQSPEQQVLALQTVFTPLLAEMATACNTPMTGPRDVMPVLRVHHLMMAVGNVFKGFPDYPNTVPADWIQPPLAEFRQTAETILVALGAMNHFKVVRDAARFAFARMINAAGPTMTELLPRLMSNLLAQFESSELSDFIGFIGLVVHKLKDDVFPMLDELLGPLTTHISTLLAQPISGTDDKTMQSETKKAYLTFLNSIMSSNLQGVFLSERNSPNLQLIIEIATQIASDINDNSNQKLAIIFLSKVTPAFGTPPTATANGNATQPPSTHSVPGFERFLYERVIPLTFNVPLDPNFNIKDGQSTVVMLELAGLLHLICRTRGQEAYDFVLSVFLPAQNCPPDTALDLVTKIRDLDPKVFRKYFSDFIKALRGAT